MPLGILRNLNSASRKSIRYFGRSYALLPDVQIGSGITDLKSLHLLGYFVRRGEAPPKTFYDRLVQLKPLGPSGMRARDRFEWCLFLFSEKDWSALSQSLVHLHVKELPLGKHRNIIIDLAWLCKHRLRLKGKNENVSTMEYWLKKSLPYTSSMQIELLSSFEKFIEDHPDGDRHDIIRAAQGYTPYFSLASVSTLYSRDAPFEQGNIIPHRWVRSSVNEKVVSVGVDRNYYELYFNSFLKCVEETAPDIGVHLCAVDFEPNLEDLPAKVGISMVSIPQELELSLLSRRAFFASARYFSLYDCLSQYQQVHVSDIDGIIVNNISEDFTASVTLHSSVKTSKLGKLPFERVSAASVSVKRCDEGLEFAKYVKSYLQYGFQSSDQYKWYIDQNALFAAWQDLNDKISIETDRLSFFRQAKSWKLAGGIQDKIDYQSKV